MAVNGFKLLQCFRDLSSDCRHSTNPRKNASRAALATPRVFETCLFKVIKIKQDWPAQNKPGGNSGGKNKQQNHSQWRAKIIWFFKFSENAFNIRHKQSHSGNIQNSPNGAQQSI